MRKTFLLIPAIILAAGCAGHYQRTQTETPVYTGTAAMGSPGPGSSKASGAGQNEQPEQNFKKEQQP